MAQSLPQLTRELASDMMDLGQVAEVINYDGGLGSIAFDVDEKRSLSSNRISNLLPDGWKAIFVVSSDPYTTVYIEEV